jgi:hypothetical protein
VTVPKRPVEQSPQARTLSAASNKLCRSLSAILKDIPLDWEQPIDLARQLELDTNLPRRIAQAVEQETALQALSLLPGEDGVEIFIDAVADMVDGKLIDNAVEANVKVNEIIRDEVGGRARLPALLAASIPAARTRVERSAKRAAFKANGQLLGCHADLHISTFVLNTNDKEGNNCDALTINGIRGFWHHGEAVKVPFAASYSYAEDGVEQPDPGLETVTGEPIKEDNYFGLIQEYSSSPLPDFALVADAERKHLVLSPKQKMFTDTHDLLFGLVHRNAPIRESEEDAIKFSLSITPAVPTKQVVFDVLLHKDAWKDVVPELGFFRVSSRGLVHADTFDNRHIDQIHFEEHLEDFKVGALPSIKEMPDYSEMVQSTMEKLGWNPREYRLYRAKIQFPMLFVQAVMRFVVPK